MNAEAQEKCVKRLVDKIRKNSDKIISLEETDLDGADVVIVSYGITSRVALKAITKAKAKGIKVGHLRLITAWPFPEKRLLELAQSVKAFVMPELNYGQMYFELQRVLGGKAATFLVPHGGGTVHDPEVIYKKILEAAKHGRAKEVA
jgi:2-oxoglutarate ferredoxin oxidoreductase subunit alpha